MYPDVLVSCKNKVLKAEVLEFLVHLQERVSGHFLSCARSEGDLTLKRLVWVLVPVVLLVVVVLATRYLIEHTDGPQQERVLAVHPSA